ncbi:hypothetical protein A2V82_08440 [candidate division KSB1 bacterium RBG_16_48_16]|nr:MAG: hypothetical protein A2V82_08440 [candidate division KSB1 bacterium RBG_16_48_16]
MTLTGNYRQFFVVIWQAKFKNHVNAKLQLNPCGFLIRVEFAQYNLQLPDMAIPAGQSPGRKVESYHAKPGLFGNPVTIWL